MPHGSHGKFPQVEVINSLKQESEITSLFHGLLDGTSSRHVFLLQSHKLINTWTDQKEPIDSIRLIKEGKIPPCFRSSKNF